MPSTNLFVTRHFLAYLNAANAAIEMERSEIEMLLIVKSFLAARRKQKCPCSKWRNLRVS
ncbi:MAG: hypothetical protein SO471_12940 [Anaerobutyricum hallii]|nr:hypothetical protein [Anaerobutyricum hallii]